MAGSIAVPLRPKKAIPTVVANDMPQSDVSDAVVPDTEGKVSKAKPAAKINSRKKR